MNSLQTTSPKTVILANTHIQNPNLEKWLKKLKEKLDKAKIQYEVFIDNFPDSLDIYTELIIIGGDGSINYAVNKYRQISIPISIIPLGTGNDLYASLTHNQDINKSIETAVNGTTYFIDAGMCNKQIFLNTFSVGFDAQVTYDSVKIAKLLPHQLKYVAATLKNLLFYKAKSYTINDKTDTYTQLTLMNGPRYGNGIQISPNSSLNDGHMELIMLQEIRNVITKIKFLLKLKSGKHIYEKVCNIRQMYDKIVIIVNNDIKYQIDGECYQGNYFELKILPKQYQFKI